MTAFLFIPDRGGLARRVNFANIASLFSEVEEPPPDKRGRRVLQILAALMLVLVALGDTVLVAQPDTLNSTARTGQRVIVGSGRTASF